MGKTTDKAIDSLAKQSAVCKGLVTSLRAAAEEMKANGDEWDQYSGDFLREFNRLHYSGVTDENEKLKDGKYKTAAAPFRKVEADREEIWTRGMELRNKTRVEINKLSDLIGALRTWVAKRSKSKNPFKSKASIPAAKAAITNYENVRDVAEAAFQLLGPTNFR